ncbi:hypothetical protein AAFF_G00348740 [Aldrovandia affinis]|uniref:Uncharacterized protein n=1 Tax=Aldrovandia affinis TaxID=143900 RepID=A0AAD7SJR7_9TELE|nr:hypothetical protein AAFF_G00348740 [Aldrovandia affinis]
MHYHEDHGAVDVGVVNTAVLPIPILPRRALMLFAEVFGRSLVADGTERTRSRSSFRHSGPHSIQHKHQEKVCLHPPSENYTLVHFISKANMINKT